MKVMMKMLVVMLVVGLAGLAYGQNAPAAGDKPAALKGTVVKVDGANVTVKSKADGKEVVVKTDDKTAVVIDKTEGKKVSDLVAGMSVTVTPADGTATEIKAKSPKAPKAPAN